MTNVTQTKPAKTAKRATIERVLRADARRNRAAVIKAAKKLFADQGLDAQMPDVAKAAKVGVGTVYRHFPTKDDLIAALAAERFERLAVKAREGLEREDAWEGFCEFIRFAAQIQADDRGLCEVMGSRPEIMDPAAVAAGLPELSDRRAAGERDEAARVKKLRRPSVAAWIINRAALAARGHVEEFAAASGALEEAQRRAVEGGDDGASDWRAAAAREREAVAEVVEA